MSQCDEFRTHLLTRLGHLRDEAQRHGWTATMRYEAQALELALASLTSEDGQEAESCEDDHHPRG